MLSMFRRHPHLDTSGIPPLGLKDKLMLICSFNVVWFVLSFWCGGAIHYMSHYVVTHKLPQGPPSLILEDGTMLLGANVAVWLTVLLFDRHYLYRYGKTTWRALRD